MVSSKNVNKRNASRIFEKKIGSFIFSYGGRNKLICVLTLFGEMDFQHVLKKRFHSNDIYFIEDNCTTSVQLTTQVEARCKEVDAVIIYSSAMNMDIIRVYVEELRTFTENLRIVLILKGDKSSFLRSKINEYWDLKLDLIFDVDGFDADEMVAILRKGKLSNKEFKSKKSEHGFSDDVVFSAEHEEFIREEKRGFKFPDKKEKNVYKDDFAVGESFSEPQGHFSVGVFNAARGAGATWTVVNLARYFVMHNYKACVVDMSSNSALSMAKLKNIDVYTSDFDIEELKSKYNVVIIDFGTPVEVSPDGTTFKLMSEYKPESIQCFNGCDIKLIMGFSDSWNIQKIGYFFINETWRNKFDNSYLFIIANNPEKVRKLFPEGNFYSREDDYREHILEAFRKDENR